MKWLALIVCVLASGYSYSACNYFVEGESEQYSIDISDGGCLELDLQIYENDKLSSAKNQFLFGNECTLERAPETVCYSEGNCRTFNGISGFACHAGGGSVLAGTRYQRAADEQKHCELPGLDPVEVTLRVFECTEGCDEKDIPLTFKDFYICD